MVEKESNFLSPFSQPGQEYDDQIGVWRLRTYHYRIATFLFMGFSALLSMGFLWLAEQPRERVIAVQMLRTGVSTGVSFLPLGSSSLLHQGEVK